MTRKNEIIDDIFRESLNGYIDEIPSKNIWANISRKLLMKDILKFSFVRLSVLLVLLLASLSFFIPSNSKKSLLNTSNTKLADNNIQLSKISSNQNIDITTKSQSNNNQENNAPSDKLEYQKEIINQKVSQTDIKQKNRQIPTTIKKNLKTDLVVKTNLSIQIVSNEDEKELNTSSTADNNRETISMNLVSSKGFNLSSQNNNSLITANKHNTNSIFSNNLSQILPIPEGLSNSPFKPQRPEFSIEAWASPLWIKKSISTNEKTFTDHVAQRNATEKPLINRSYGFNLKMIHNNWLLITGLNYSEYSEKADYSLFSSNIDSNIFITYNNTSYWKYDTIEKFQDPIDTTIWHYIFNREYILDSVAFENTDYDTSFTSTDYSFSNTYKWIEIPLLIGREFSKDRFSFSVATGISYGFLTGSKASILHYDNTSIIVIDKNQAPLKNGMFNYILQVGVDYTLTKKIGIICQPMFRYNLNSMFNKSYPVDQKYYSVGINCGLRYKL